MYYVTYRYYVTTNDIDEMTNDISVCCETTVWYLEYGKQTDTNITN